ncbi:MAG: ADP-ribosylglycohydrolase family protein [Bacteroidaceae bacterium]|jgi:ADP-ribosylglycohydrolase/protein-tyrosine phosphatase
MELLGAIIGDIVGSTREWNNIKTVDFELVPSGSHFTDDTVMTLAVAEWLMTDPEHKAETLVECMQRLGRKYSNAGYGGMFYKWLESDNPKPYGSFGNGSAMRVSPVGLYANSLEEALKLARISASVTHNHPEGIKGAQAIAGCVFLKKNEWADKDKIRCFIKEKIGYNLDFELEKLRDNYGFDVTCQGSVPIAIKAYLECSIYPPEKALRLAVSMGGDSDTIGAMTASIASAECFSSMGGGFSTELIDKCRALLPADLLEINDRFEDFISRPLYQSYYLHGDLFAGEYPGDKDEEITKQKIRNMLHFGVKHFVDLTEEGELKPYCHLLPKDVTYLRFPIPDNGVPQSIESVNRLLDKICDLEKMGGYTYVHCRRGVGRTGTIVGCLKARELYNYKDSDALTALRNFFKDMPKSVCRQTPETHEQEEFIKTFSRSAGLYIENQKEIIKDSIRGCLMAGAAGDALGYTVEFMSRDHILSQYGRKGITQFELAENGKAWVSDATRMTLFTACGMLTNVTRGYMRGIGGAPEYYTSYNWLCNQPELTHRSASGSTRMSSLPHKKTVKNNSKGCVGIMRAASMALLAAGYKSRDERFYDIPEMDEAGAKVVEATHKHPLAFLPAAMLTHLLYKLVYMDAEQVKREFRSLALETIFSLDSIFVGQYAEYKRILAELTRKAVTLAENNCTDAENIMQLGEGWRGEEAWAIALYCAVRHVDSIEEAIIAAVNHDGDSDSTGSVCGNIMGAIYGYEALKRQRLFCPPGKKLEDTLELANITLALADDLYTSCIISEYEPIDTPEKQQWYERYCEMKPTGIG